MATSVVGHAAQVAFAGVSLHSSGLQRSPSFKRGQGLNFVSLGNGNAPLTGLSSRLQFSKRLTPLQVRKSKAAGAAGESNHSFSTRLSAHASASTPNSARTTSSTLLDTSLHVPNAEFVRELGRIYKLPSPDRTYLDKKHPYADLHVGDRWNEIQGSSNWEGLLDKMDPVLRGQIIRYGEFAQATYDAFDADHQSIFLP